MYIRSKRLLQNWFKSGDAKKEWDDVVKTANGIMCEKCGEVVNNGFWFDFWKDQIFLCRSCFDEVLSEELPPPGAANSKGLGVRFRVLVRDNFTCVYCGRNPVEDGVKLEVDHIIPKSKGGTDEERNLVTACRDCNQGKKDLMSEHILRYLNKRL